MKPLSLYSKIVNKSAMVELNLEKCWRKFMLQKCTPVVLEDLFIKAYVINIRCISYHGVLPQAFKFFVENKLLKWLQNKNSIP